MSGNILFAFPPEPGHILPTIPIAQRLSALGYQVIYLSSSDFSARLSAYGFRVVPLSSRHDPPSTPDPLYWTDSTGDEQWDRAMESEGKPLKELIEQRLREITSHYHLNGIVADHLFRTAYRVDFAGLGCGSPVILVWTSLPRWDQRIPTLSNMALCPEDFELPQFRRPSSELRYVEPSIDLERHEASFNWKNIDPSKRLVLCTFGTQARRHPEVISKIKAVIQTAKELPEIQFVIATGCFAKGKAIELENEPPENVRLEPMVPQIKLLPKSDLLITHGGLGSIKEALHFGVPMLVLPLGYDQPQNAARVMHFGLGSALLSSEISAAALQSKIVSILDDAVVRSNVQSFKKIFRDKMGSSESVSLIRAIVEPESFDCGQL